MTGRLTLILLAAAAGLSACKNTDTKLRAASASPATVAADKSAAVAPDTAAAAAAR